MSARRLLIVGNFLSGSIAHRHFCEEFADRMETRGWSVIRTSTELSRRKRLVDMMATTVRRRRDYDVVHLGVFSGRAFVWAEAIAFILRRLGKPFAITLHGGELPRFARAWPRRVRRLLESAAIVTAPSRYLQRELADYAPRIELVPNAVDLAQYPYTPRSSPRPHMMWLRSFHAVYNPVMAVEVLACVVRAHPGASLTMIGFDKGDGSLDEVRARALALGVADRLEVIPGIAKTSVGAHLARGDIFLNTTNADNTPISMLEAMACGLPVVTTSVGGIPDLVEDGVQALLVPRGDVSAMSAAVERILVEPDLARRLAQNALELVAKCDWSHVLARWECILEEIQASA